MTTNLCNWDGLPKKGFPLIFHGIEGKDEREGNSPSFFNTAEATTVIKYVRELLDVKSFGLEPKEIGIISPYRKQVSKCMHTNSKGLPEINRLPTFPHDKNSDGNWIGVYLSKRNLERITA